MPPISASSPTFDFCTQPLAIAVLATPPARLLHASCAVERSLLHVPTPVAAVFLRPSTLAHFQTITHRPARPFLCIGYVYTPHVRICMYSLHTMSSPLFASLFPPQLYTSLSDSDSDSSPPSPDVDVGIPDSERAPLLPLSCC